MNAKHGTIVVDFDGVLHSYTSGWQGEDVIPDPPVEGAQAFVRRLHADGYAVVVASTRANSEKGRGAMAVWFVKNGFPTVHIAHGKPSGRVYIDDRALRFNGSWPSNAEIEAAATPWNKL